MINRALTSVRNGHKAQHCLMNQCNRSGELRRRRKTGPAFWPATLWLGCSSGWAPGTRPGAFRCAKQA